MAYRGMTIAATVLIVCCATLLHAQNRSAVEAQFQSWLENTAWPRASSAGVPRGVFDAAFDDVTLNWDLPDLVPPGTMAQPVNRQSEFGAPARYFAANTVEGAALVGRQMARNHANTLAAVERATGVPGQIVLAVWGRESAYGRASIPYDVFEVLGTKGFMSTRASYFTEELVAALQIAARGDVPEGAMKSSWAGALGQPQFMPSSFLRYAADGSGDGRADIWGSEADTLASIGNYLAQHGWVPGRDWGFEVRVPASVSCTLEGPDQGRSIADWAAAGITRVSGNPFPTHELGGVGYLLMPAGRTGPAFIVTPNFFVLKQYNNSDLYALFVGHVGDRIHYDASDFTGRWGATDQMRRADVAAMQRGLETLGHDVGGADGLAGFKTRRSIGRWQEATGQAATCWPDTAMIGALAR